MNHNNGPGTDVIWRTLSPVGIAVPGTVNLFRLTWSADHSATFSAVLETNTGGGTYAEIPVSITIPPVPGPGGLAVAGVAFVVGKRRRRSCV